MNQPNNEIENMIICKDGNYAYVGATAAEAYTAYMKSTDDHNNRNPHELEWYSANEMILTMTLAAKPKATPVKAAAKK